MLLPETPALQGDPSKNRSATGNEPHLLDWAVSPKIEAGIFPPSNLPYHTNLEHDELFLVCRPIRLRLFANNRVVRRGGIENPFVRQTDQEP